MPGDGARRLAGGRAIDQRLDAAPGRPRLAEQAFEADQAQVQLSVRRVQRQAQALPAGLELGLAALAQQCLEFFQPGLQGVRAGRIEQPPLASHLARRAQQAEQVEAKHAQGLGTGAAECALEPGVVALGVRRGDPPQRREQLAAFVGAAQLRRGRLQAGLPGRLALVRQLAFQAPRPEQYIHQRRAEDAQADLRAAGHRLVEHRRRIGAGRQGDDRRGVAGQDETVGRMVVQQRRAGGAERQPERHQQEEGQRRLTIERDHADGHQRTGAGADQAEHALGQDHAAIGLADHEHRHQCPLRLLQLQAEGQVQGQPAGQQGLHRELQFVQARAQQHLHQVGGKEGRLGHRGRPEIHERANY